MTAGPAPVRRVRDFRLALPEGLVLLAVATLCAHQLFVPPIVGMADNGDFDRVLDPLGLRPVAQTRIERYFQHVNVDYLEAPRGPMLLFSSQLVMGELAKLVGKPFTRAGTFHLAALCAVHLVLYLLALYLILLSSQTLRGPPRVVIASVVLLASSDVAYVATFNSFYTEGPALVFLLLSIGVALLGALRKAPASATLPAFFVSAAMLISAKPQYYPFALPLAALAVAILARGHGRRRAVPAAVGAGTLILLMVNLSIHLSHRFNSPVLWDTVFYSILSESPDPARDLRDLGLDTSLVRYQGIPAWAGHISTPHVEVTKKLGFAGIARFYLSRPKRSLEIAERCARGAFEWRDPLIGNYTRDSGKPAGVHAPSLLGWSDMERRLFPRSLLFLVLFFTGFVAVASWELGRAGLSRPEGALAGLCLSLAAMAVLEFAVVAAFSGMKDVVKHLYLFQVLFDACFGAALAWGASRLASVLPWGFWRAFSVESQTEEPTTRETD